MIVTRYCLSTWPSRYGRAPPDLLHQESGGPGSIPGASTVNQNVHPSRIGNFVAMSRQMGDHCWMVWNVNRASLRCAMWGLQPGAQTTTCWLWRLSTCLWVLHIQLVTKVTLTLTFTWFDWLHALHHIFPTLTMLALIVIRNIIIEAYPGIYIAVWA